MKLVENDSGKTVFMEENGICKFNSAALKTKYGNVKLPAFMTKEGKFKGRPVVKASEPDYVEAFKLALNVSPESNKYHWE